MGKIVCPQCEKDDRIEKVSGIVATGTTSVKVSGPTGTVFNVGGDWGAGGGWTTLSGTQTTDLAKSLAPPPDPRVGAGIGCFTWFAVAWLAGIAVIGCGITAATLFQDQGVPVEMADFLAAPGMVVLFGGAAYLIVRRGARRRKEAEAKVPAWEAATTLWERSYYCYRNSVVFDPETIEAIAPAIQAPAEDKPPEHFA